MKPHSASVRHDDACGQGPETGEHVLVQCPGFRCLAYRAGDESWHSVFGSQSALEALEVVSCIESAGPSVPQNVDALLEQADAEPPPSRILPRLPGELSNPETDVTRVAELVAVDPVLAARLLRMCGQNAPETQRAPAPAQARKTAQPKSNGLMTRVQGNGRTHTVKSEPAPRAPELAAATSRGGADLPADDEFKDF